MSLLLLGVGGVAGAASTTERTVLGIGGASLSAANSYYCPLGGQILAAGTTLANAEMAWPTDGTFRNLYARASGSSWTAGTTFTLYKNGSSTGLTCTIAASGTAANDTSNSVSVSAGDTIAIGVTLAAGSGSIFIRQCTVQFERSGQISTLIQASNMGGSSATSVRWARMGGGTTSAPALFITPETEAQFKALEACTVSKLQGYVTTATSGAQLTSRKNTAAGAATVTFTGNAQRQQDNSNSDSLAVDDLFTIQRAATAILCANTGVMYTSGTAKKSMICSGGQLATIAAGSTGYGCMFGASVNSNSTTETNAAAVVPFAARFSALRIYVQTNASSATTTVTLMKNGSAETALEFTVGAGSTGWFQDTTGTVDFAAGDTVSVRFSGVTTGALTVYHIAALIEDIT